MLVVAVVLVVVRVLLVVQEVLEVVVMDHQMLMVEGL
tara:strand:- start:198 stop:308 length:111 start_codon:yes stop_codon:yes gene_type:complete